MHMIFRTLWIFLRKNFLKKALFSDRTIVSMRVLPTDLDILWHVNNGVYFSFMDFGRWDAIFRNGAFDKSKANDWYSVVAGETIKFKKSLKLWDKFEIETQIKGYDEKYFFIQQRFLKEGDLMAIGLVKVRFLKRKGGTVPVKEVLLAMGEHSLDGAHELSHDWFGLESKHLV
jgi:YbgC/YbaW family acyl-CoA thioester hydrolase